MDVINPTHLSCCHGLLQRLLAHGLNTQAIMVPCSFSPLHLAALQGNLEVVNLLLEAGAQVNLTGLNIPVPLGCAAMVSCLSATTGVSLDPDHDSSSHCSNRHKPALLLVPQDWPV